MAKENSHFTELFIYIFHWPFAALRSIPTNFNYVFPLRLRGDSVFLAGATTDGGDDHFVKRFNLTSGKETQAVKIPEPWGLATVKLGAQHCIAGSYG